MMKVHILMKQATVHYLQSGNVFFNKINYSLVCFSGGYAYICIGRLGTYTECVTGNDNTDRRHVDVDVFCHRFSTRTASTLRQFNNNRKKLANWKKVWQSPRSMWQQQSSPEVLL